MKTYEVVYNACYGGFSVSEELCEEYEKITGKRLETHYYLDRHDKVLIDLVKKMGKEASGSYADLRIDTICGEMYRIDEYDGMESVVTPDRQEWVVIEEG